MCLNGIPSLIKVSPQRQVAVLLNNSAATCLELQQFEEALLHSSTVVLLQVADEGLLSKAPLWGIMVAFSNPYSTIGWNGVAYF